MGRGQQPSTVPLLSLLAAGPSPWEPGRARRGTEGRQAPALLTLDVEKGAEAGSGQLAGAGHGVIGQRPQQSRQGAKRHVGTSCLHGGEEEQRL